MEGHASNDLYDSAPSTWPPTRGFEPTSTGVGLGWGALTRGVDGVKIDTIVARIETILDEMRSDPKGVRFADACKVATHFFGEPRQRGTSHCVWKMPWPGDPRVNLQRSKDGTAPPGKTVCPACGCLCNPKAICVCRPNRAGRVKADREERSRDELDDLIDDLDKLGT